MLQASMRPSGITDGISSLDGIPITRPAPRFNEAVGYYRRNRRSAPQPSARRSARGFNEAVGYYRRNHESSHPLS